MITQNIIAGKESAQGTQVLQSTNPTTQKVLPEEFIVATKEEVDAAANAAFEAWKVYRKTSGAQKAVFLRTIATEIENLGSTLIQRAMAESGLPEGRITGERGRTCNQLRLFADWVEEGSWVEATIDEAMPERQPMPRVDLRKMAMAVGPVAVFTASNFPLAFSTAGGDTASALAAGCPVVVKGHPSHLGTNALVSAAISTAIEKCGLPKGVFSSIQGEIKTGQNLVKHPSIKAVGFTGSYRGGKALFDLANSRPEPIPVYAEMGSNNPIFILQQKLHDDVKGLAGKIAGSVNLGAGQFCTNPGILVMEKGNETDEFLIALQSAFEQQAPAAMLNEGIYRAYESGRTACLNTGGVWTKFLQKTNDDKWEGMPAIGTVDVIDFLHNPKLQDEVFGPFTLVVLCKDKGEMLAVADHLHGQLTATVFGNEEELVLSNDLIDILDTKAGRVIFNGVPTGVEVSPAMHHGGPFPSTTNAIYTSVGTDAIKRFVRPVTFQDAPQALLPDELKDGNPLNICRIVNGLRVIG